METRYLAINKARAVQAGPVAVSAKSTVYTTLELFTCMAEKKAYRMWIIVRCVGIHDNLPRGSEAMRRLRLPITMSRLAISEHMVEQR